MLLLRRVLIAALVAVLSWTALAVVRAPADAVSTVLCRGFSNCATNGYATYGYPAEYRKMWWRMYAGHNCTNYVAYRMVKAGMSPERPWSGSGNARNWGYALADKTDSVPAVGAVAWWSANHVGVVEEVVDSNTIVISEDQWGGDFQWRRITKAGGGWPTGFIHLVDKSLAPMGDVTITGTPQVGQTLRAQLPQFRTAPATLKYRWYVNDKFVGEGVTYRLAPADRQGRVHVRVTAQRPKFHASILLSAKTVAVRVGQIDVSDSRVLEGEPRLGETLRVVPPQTNPDTATHEVVWLRDGKRLQHSGNVLRLDDPSLVGSVVSARAVFRSPGYAARSSATESVTIVNPVVPVTKEPALRIRDVPVVGKPIGVDVGQVGIDANVSVQWFRTGKPIPGATRHTYYPTAVDRGEVLAARIQYRAPKHSMRTIWVRPVKPRVLPETWFNAIARPGVIDVRVRDRGVGPAPGQVSLELVGKGPQTRSWGQLSGGRAVFHQDWIRPGRYTVRIVYSDPRAPRTEIDRREVTIR